MSRRLPGFCFLCGDPAVNEWCCVTHLWAGPVTGVSTNGLERLTREHAYWIERLTPEQIVDLASYLEPSEAAA